MKDIVLWRIAVFLIGAFAGALGAKAAYEYALILERGVVTYFVIGAPMVAAMVAIIPPLASHLWSKEQEGFIAGLLWLALIPCAAFMFYTAAERVHNAKETQSADYRAREYTVGRAQIEFDAAKSALLPLETAEAKAKWNPNCSKSNACQTTISLAEAGRQRLAKAENALNQAHREFLTESKWKAPSWLLPLCMDIVAFLFVWAGLSGPWVRRKPKAQMTPEEAKSWLESLIGLLGGRKLNQKI